MKKLASFNKTVYRIGSAVASSVPIAYRGGDTFRLTDKDVMLISVGLISTALNNVALEELACHIAINDSITVDLTENVGILASHIYAGSIPLATANFAAMYQTTYRNIEPGTIIIPANQSLGLYFSMANAAVGQRLTAFATLQWIYI